VLLVTNDPTITVNGAPRQLADVTTLAHLIESLGLTGQPVAAEVNGRLVPHRERAERRLAPGDVVELVTLVGGG